MRPLLIRSTTVLLSTLLGACGFMTPAKQYAGATLPVSAVAVVQGFQGSLLGDDYHATLSGYAFQPDGAERVVQHLGLPGFTDYPHEIHLTPGLYALEVYCFKSLAKPTYRPTVEVALQAGHTYTVKCEAAAGHASVVISQDTRSL